MWMPASKGCDDRHDPVHGALNHPPNQNRLQSPPPPLSSNRAVHTGTTCQETAEDDGADVGGEGKRQLKMKRRNHETT